MRRSVPGSVIAALVLTAGLAAALRLSPPPAGQLVVQGRVTGAGGEPVRGIKVWLNAWPHATVAAGGMGPVTVIGSAITSATGRYTLRVPSMPVVEPDAINGVVRFSLMAGNSTGSDMPTFSRGLPGGTATVVLHLTRAD